MNVLFLSPQPFFVERGTPIAVRAAAEALAADGHRVDLLTYHVGQDVPLGPGVRVLRIPRPPLVRRVPIGPSWQKAVCDVSRTACRFAREGVGPRSGGARRGYDLVHAVEEAAFIALLLRRRFGLPFVYDMDSLMSEQIAEKSRLLRPAAALFSRWERAAIRGSVGVLAVCPALADIARRHHPAGRVALLPDTPLSGGGEPAPAPELAAIDGLKLVYVGNLEPYQGVDLMVRAFAQIASEHPEAALVIVGGDAAGAARLGRLSPALCASGRIRFLGTRPVSSLGALLAGADILVSPRRAGRNTPMKLYSYLESGRPVLATRLPTHTQVLNDAAAVLTDPTPEAIAAGMRRLLSSPALRRRVGEAGRELVRHEYSELVFRRRLRDFYGDVGRLLHHVPPASPAPLIGPPSPATLAAAAHAAGAP